MKQFEFNPFVEGIILRFKCPKCGCDNQTATIIPPQPDWAADSHVKSERSDYEICVCGKCESEFDITVFNGIYGGYAEIEDVEEIEGEEIFAEDMMDDTFFNAEDFKVTLNETKHTLAEIAPLSADTKKQLFQLLYANLISKLEAYLCDTIINYVSNDEAAKQRFLCTYEPLAEQNFPMKSVIAKYKGLNTIIINALKAIVYHNLGLVAKIYKNTAKVDFPSDSLIEKAISIRHDIVHRNGKDKDGNPTVISEDNVKELAEHVDDFIQNINNQIFEQNFESVIEKTH